MIEESDLKQSLRTLAEGGPQDASPAVQQRLLVRFRKRRATRRWVYVAGTSIPVLAAVVLSVVLWHNRNATPRVSAATIVDQTSGFITLPYGQSGVPLEQPVIVRIDIPVSQLGAMGVQARPRSATGMVKADLLVGQDGIARAVRFVE